MYPAVSIPAHVKLPSVDQKAPGFVWGMVGFLTSAPTSMTFGSLGSIAQVGLICDRSEDGWTTTSGVLGSEASLGRSGAAASAADPAKAARTNVDDEARIVDRIQR